MKEESYARAQRLLTRSVIAGIAVSALVIAMHIPWLPTLPDPVRVVKGNSVYFNLTTGNFTFSIDPTSINQITANDNWSGVNSVEGYMGMNLTATHGIDPQTVLGAEFANNQLPNSPTNVAANKGNPSAFNAGGVAEFDGGTYLAIGLQGSVQANPYLVFYLNTSGRTNVVVNYMVQDIDGGSNDSVSRLAVQYRVGETGLFTNIPAGYIADATDGGVAGRTTNISVALPAAANNQPKVQVRVITTNAANSSGSSTPDEWIGINNVTVSSSTGPSAAGVSVGGRVIDPSGRGVRGATVTMYNDGGSAQTALTNGFGYYGFSDVEVGSTYTFIVVSKRYSFTPRTVTIVDELTDLIFVGDK